MKYYQGFILWNRIKNEDGTLYEPQTQNEFFMEADKWWSYLCLSRHKGFRFWQFGYYAHAYDCQGHEGIGFGPFSIQWSIPSSYGRAMRN